MGKVLDSYYALLNRVPLTAETLLEDRCQVEVSCGEQLCKLESYTHPYIPSLFICSKKDKMQLTLWSGIACSLERHLC
jgi:hypothetical protein